MYELAGTGFSQLAIDKSYERAKTWFSKGYFSGNMPAFNYMGTPFAAVINLHTGQVMRVDTEYNQVSPDQMVKLIKQAANDAK